MGLVVHSNIYIFFVCLKGAAVAAVLSDKMKHGYPDLKNIGIILCGGNIDIDMLPW